MLPAKVKVVAVDISQPVVTKLLDRGITQAIGVVTDVGTFLPARSLFFKNLTAKQIRFGNTNQ